MYKVIAGSVTTAGTRQRATVTDPKWCSEALLQNTDGAKTLYVGGPDVDSTHCIKLTTGQTLPLGVGNEANDHNLYDLWLDASADGCTFAIFYHAI